MSANNQAATLRAYVTWSMIHSDFRVVLDPRATDTEKLLALKLLGHWVGAGIAATI